MHVSVLFALALPACASDAEPTGKVLWRGDYETGNLSQWLGAHCKPGGVTIVTDPVRQGKYAARFEVSPGDDPIDASGERCEVREPVREEEGDESWWSWSTYFPDAFALNPNQTWNIFAQWHAQSSGLGGPPVAFELDEGSGEAPEWPLELRVRGGNPSSPREKSFPLGQLEAGTWHDFLFHVKWSSDHDEGFVEVWMNGAPVVPKTALATLYRGSGVYVKQGFYRGDSDVTVSVVHDGLRLGTSRDAVSPRTARPSLPGVRVSSSLRDGQSITGEAPWRAQVAGGPVHHVDFLIDGQLRWTEREAPYSFGGDGGSWDVSKESPGDRTLEIRAFALDGRVTTSELRVQISDS